MKTIKEIAQKMVELTFHEPQLGTRAAKKMKKLATDFLLYQVKKADFKHYTEWQIEELLDYYLRDAWLYAEYEMGNALFV